MSDAKALFRPEAILFDLDGCLVDTAPDFHRVVNLQRRRHELPDLPLEAIRPVVSAGSRALVALSFGLRDDDPEVEIYRAELLDLYLEHVHVDSRLFEGLDAIIDRIMDSGMAWGVVTNKPRLYAEALMASMGLDQRYGVLVCPDDVTRSKPDPEPLLLACRTLGVSPETCWYLGDHIRDIEAGNAAGMFTMATLYGYIETDGKQPPDWGADRLIEQPLELATALDQVLG